MVVILMFGADMVEAARVVKLPPTLRSKSVAAEELPTVTPEASVM